MPTAIEWSDETWNPTTGCDRVSPGCANCYALTLAARLKRMGQAAYQVDGDPRTSGPGFALTIHPDRLQIPLRRWRKPRRIFVDSMSDLFHPAVPDGFILDVFAVMALAPRHTFQVLTKRPERMQALVGRPDFRENVAHEAWHLRDRLPHDPGYFRWHDQAAMPWPLPNVWMGTSVENQHWADVRIPLLLRTPAAVRWLSMEPLLGPVDLGRSIGGTQWIGGQRGHAGRHNGDGSPGCPPALHHHHDDRCEPGLDWIVTGGESGPRHRPVDPAWIRGLRDQVVHAGVPFLFKQWGGRTSKGGGRDLDGRTWDEYPAAAA